VASKKMDKRLAIFAGLAVLIVLAVGIINIYQGQKAADAPEIITYSEFLDDVEQGQVQSVTMVDQAISGARTDRSTFRTYAADDPGLVQSLREHAVRITAREPAPEGPSVAGILTSVLPMLLLVGIAVFFMWRMSPGNAQKTGAFGKSKARLLTEGHGRVTFDDVAGVDEAKENLQEIVEFLRSPGKFEQLGGRIPKGVLLVGPPGSGKTLLARAVAGEANVPFYTISGSDFVEMFVGIGASRVRDLFEQAKQNAPCIVFMDEIDAVGRHRGAGLGQGNDEREQTLNALLVEMDGFQPNEGIILIAATNRPDVLDPALIRPGRFDREIVVDNPDVAGREQILRIHARRIPMEADVDLALVARRSSGFSGAELMNLVNEAALRAVRRGRSAVGRRELDEAQDKVTMGDERRSHVLTEGEKRLTAYREGGRALVALMVPGTDPVHKVTIVPRGRTTGMVSQLPENEQTAMTLEQATSRLAVLMAGRAAEELTFGRRNITSGSAGDIEEATRLARNMVTRWGFSEELGPIAYEENEEEVFLGHSVARQRHLSELDAQRVTAEVRRLVEAAFGEARRILVEHGADLTAVALALLEHETLTGNEVRALVMGDPVSQVTALSPPTPLRGLQGAVVS